MSEYVKSLKRLYEKHRITKEDVAERVESGKITANDYEYIIGEPYGG